MRGILVAVLVFVLAFVGPSILDRYMKDMPDVMVRIAATCLVGVALMIALLSEPFYIWLRLFRAHPFGSTVLVGASVGLMLAVIWLFLIIGFPSSPHYAASGTSQPSPTPAPDVSQQLADFGRRFDKFTEAFTRNPNVDADAKLSVLKDEAEWLAKKEELTKAQKDTLKEKSLTLQSLEEGRKHYAEAVELEKRQQENAAQQRVIEQQQAAQRDEELEKKFAKRFAAVAEYVIATLYEKLDKIAKQSSEAISTNFPGDRPTIYNSTFLKDGKFQRGRHFVHIGSHKEWEFIIIGPGENIAEPMARRAFQCQISAGRRDPMRRSTDWYSLMTVSSEATPVNTEPVKLNVQCFERHGAFSQKILHSESCTESEYQKPIQAAIASLIQDRYNAFQLGKDASPTPPSSTPGKEASPH